MSDTDLAWVSWNDQKPDREGIYRWKTPCRNASGLEVTFLAHMRTQTIVSQSVLVPAFAHWDGYRHLIPQGTMWSQYDGKSSVKEHTNDDIQIVGLTVNPCPFCGQIPSWKGVNKTSGGILVGAFPFDFNNWWLECCAYARTPHMVCPSDLCEARNSLLGRCNVPDLEIERLRDLCAKALKHLDAEARCGWVPQENAKRAMSLLLKEKNSKGGQQ